MGQRGSPFSDDGLVGRSAETSPFDLLIRAIAQSVAGSSGIRVIRGSRLRQGFGAASRDPGSAKSVAPTQAMGATLR